MDHRRVAIFVEEAGPPPTAPVNRLIGGSTRSSGGDR